MSVGINVAGSKALQKKLDELGRRSSKKATRAAMRAATTIVARAVKAAVPVDEGLLKKSMTYKVTNRGMSFRGFAGADAKKLQSYDAEDRRPSNIDHLVEFGHVDDAGNFTPPRPFIRPAAAASKGAAHARFLSELAAQIDIEAMKKANGS